MSKRVDYRSIAPEGTFIHTYMQYMDDVETAYSYDFWCACFILSTVLGRGIVINRPRIPVHLNLYLILCAESGTTRKSTAVGHAMKLLKEFYDDAIQDDPALASRHPRPIIWEAKTTPEVVERDLYLQGSTTGTSSGVVGVSELVTFLGRERYNIAMPSLLTDLYDCPSSRYAGGSVRSGSAKLQHVYVTLLSASTPSWLIRAVNPDVVEGGFTSRCLFICSEQSKRPIAWPTQAVGDIRGAVRSSLASVLRGSQHAQQVRCGVGVSDGAVEALTKWYTQRERYNDPFRSSFQAREDDHVLRLAGLLAINDGTWEIQRHHLLTAIRVVVEVREDGVGLFVGALSPSRVLIGVDKVRTKLIEAGRDGVTNSRLQQEVRTYITAEQLNTLLNIMHELNMVKRFEVPAPSGKGRPATVWRATTEMAKRRASELIQERLELQ